MSLLAARAGTCHAARFFAAGAAGPLAAAIDGIALRSAGGNDGR